MISKLIRSRRVGGAVMSNGLVSLANFALSISVARTSSISEFGTFSIALISYLFASGLIRAAFTDSALSRPNETQELPHTFQRASTISHLASVILVFWGLVSGNYYLAVLGITIPGLMALDFIRVFNSAAGSIRNSLITTSLWSTISLSFSISSIFTAISPLFVFAAWSISGAIIGYLSAFRAGIPLSPRWLRDPNATKNSLVFGADYLIGAGGTQLTTGLLGIVSDIRVLSAVRGAGTLLGPMNLISTTVRSLMLPFLSRNIDNPDRQFKSAIVATSLQVSVLAPLLLALQFIPDSLGALLLGDTWQLASLAILPMSIDSVFALIAAVAISGHRVAFAGKRTILLRLITGITRPLAVLLSAFMWGINGAAWAMAAFAIISSILWWVSYYDLSRRLPNSEISN